MKTLNYNTVVIGFGKAGKTIAAKVAASGKTVALCEKDKNMYGGTCINVGCIPSKSLYTSAKNSPSDAVFTAKSQYFKDSINEKRRLTSMLRQKNFDKLNGSPNVTVFDGNARFLSKNEIEVTTEKEKLIITGDNIIINTGSVSRIPKINGIETSKRVYTSKEIMNIDDLPEHLVVIGGGFIGLEFASMFSSFGSTVTVLQNNDCFLPREDEDIAAEIKKELSNQGISFLFNAATEKIEDVLEKTKLTVSVNGAKEEIFADAVLLATGRIPNTEGLNAEAAGVELTPSKAVKVDKYLRTSAENVWACGDVNGGMQHTYISLDDSRIVMSQFGNGTRSLDDRNNVPYSVFLKTPYARVGLNEREAKEKGLDIRILKLPTAAIPKAQVLKQTDGFLKAVISVDTGKILGIMLLCAESYEMVNTVKLAMDLDADYTVLRDMIFTHPTMSEALNDLFSM